MSHPQIPYDPLLDTSNDTHALPGQHLSTTHSNRSTPRITAQDLDDPDPDDPVQYRSVGGVGGAAGMAGVGLGGGGGLGGVGSTDFGPPIPHFLNHQTRSSTYSSSSLGGGAGDRQSGYGSIAPLHAHRDSAYRDTPSPPPAGTTAAGYAYPPGATPPINGGGGGGGYMDDPSGRTRYDMSEKDGLYEAPRAKTKRKGLIWAGVICGLLLVVAAVLIPLYLFVIKKSSSSSSTTGGGGGGGGGGSTTTGGDSHQVLITGGDGSLVTKEDGTTFAYNNSFGGYWVYDVDHPLNESAKAQSYTPSLDQPWKWGVDRVYGVNIGGWLNLEPFISPALYEPFGTAAVDEWTLSTLIRARDGNLDAIANHYATFITEEDFAQIAAAGLNWVRIPLAFWAIETYPNEPFLAKTSWTYFLKAIEWARKYGLRINLDFHAAPGSQNGWNHSGKLGDVNFLNGVMGVANAQRAMDYIRILAEFISQPEYRNVVPFFGILNEPRGGPIPEDAMKSFYAEAYQIIRTAGGSGQGNGPVISIHESFFGLSEWVGFLAGADRLAIDSHPYLVFGQFSAGNPADFVTNPCTQWSNTFGASMSAFGITAAGEWSNAINDCGLFVNAVGRGTRYEGTFESTTRLGDCAPWNDYTTWDQSIKDGLKQLSMSTMDALGDWFFWTWRIGPSLAKGRVEAPFWSYKLAIEQGWAVTDPRTSKGQCARLGATGNSFYEGGGVYTGPQTGVGVVDAIAEVPTLNTYPWPPTAIGLFANAATLPTYTATGPIQTLPVSVAGTAVQVTGTASVPVPTASVSLGSGWANPADTALMHVPIPGCAYPDPWDANTAVVPVC